MVVPGQGFEQAGLRVLLVENNPNIRLLLRTVLEALGIGAIAEAAEGAEALSRLNGFPADLAIIEAGPRPFDGFAFTRALRRNLESPDPFLPVILVIDEDKRALAEARDCGAHEILIQPVAAKALVERIGAILAGPRPFVRAEDYFGPDRRRARWAHGGTERRSRPADLVMPVPHGVARLRPN